MLTCERSFNSYILFAFSKDKMKPFISLMLRCLETKVKKSQAYVQSGYGDHDPLPYACKQAPCLCKREEQRVN